MKKTLFLTLIFTLLVSACSVINPQPTPTVIPTETPVPPTAIPTIQPSPTDTPEPTATNTPEPTNTPTEIPFKAWPENFGFHKYWIYQGKTYIYFLNAERDAPVYAVANGINLVCNADPKFPKEMQCESDEIMEVEDGKLTIELFADEAHTKSVWQKELDLQQSAYDSDLVFCEWEFRKYASGCSRHATCVNKYTGEYLYSVDSYPENPDNPWTPIGSCP